MEKELNEKKNDLITRADKVLAKAKEEKRELTEDEAMELAEIRDDVKKIKETLELKGFFDKEGGKKPMEEPKEKVEIEKEVEETRAFEEEKAFEAYLRGQYNERANNLTPAQGSGQVLIPTTIARKIIAKVYDMCPILEKSTKYNVKGKLEIPYYDESTTSITVAWATEFVDLTSNVGGFTNIELSGYLAGALSLISRSLINNSQFDIVGFVVNRMAYDIARFIENALLNSSGSVTGLSTVSNVVTAASSTALTAEELIQVQGKVKDIFQNNAIWIMNEETRTAIRQLKSQSGSFLLTEVYDLASPFKNMLLGKPVYVTDNMPTMATGKTAIYYGDMTGLATKFSEDINIEVLREKYATQHAIGVVGWLEFDSKIEDPQKIAAIKMAASL